MNVSRDAQALPRVLVKKSLPSRVLRSVSSLPRGLQIVLAYFVLHLICSLGFAAFSNPASFSYDLSMVRAVIHIVTTALAIWLIAWHARFARAFCLAAIPLNLALSLIDLLRGAADDIALTATAFGAAAGIFIEFASGVAIFTYLVLTRVSRDVFVIDLDVSPEGEGNSWDLPYRKRVKTWAFWRDLLIYFITFSFIGHWAEMLFCRLIILGVFMGDYDPTNAMLWDQWLFPFTAEGTALAMVVIALHPLKVWLLKRFHGQVRPALALSFLANAVVCTSIDFATGMVANQHYELWDYRELPFNFMGQVCLQNSLVYSIAATIVVWVAYPAMDRALRRMPRAYANALFVGLAALYAFEALLHFTYLGM